MAALHTLPAWLLAACIGAGLLVTLVLAAFLTPRHWWRRANAGALAVLVVGTAVFGWLFSVGAGKLLPQPAPLPIAVAVAAVPVLHSYRVFDDLNLRAASGTGAARIAVVPGGTTVTTTGRRDGDWWEVSARVDGRAVTGWASSLWLRRDEEVRAR